MNLLIIQIAVFKPLFVQTISPTTIFEIFRLNNEIKNRHCQSWGIIPPKRGTRSVLRILIPCPSGSGVPSGTQSLTPTTALEFQRLRRVEMRLPPSEVAAAGRPGTGSDPFSEPPSQRDCRPVTASFLCVGLLIWKMGVKLLPGGLSRGERCVHDQHRDGAP